MSNAFQISSDLVDAIVARSPLFATSIGVAGSNDRWDDLSLEGRSAMADQFRATKSALAGHLSHPDPDQRICARVLTRSLADQLEAFDEGDHLEDVRHMAATFHHLRSIFDIMDVESPEGLADIVARLETIGEPLRGYQALLAAGVSQGRVVAQRQAESMLEQVDNLAGSASAYDAIPGRAEAAGQDAGVLEEPIAIAKDAMAEFGAFLRSEYLPHARERDGVGQTRYRRMASRFVGMDVDPADAYEWGWDELARLLGEADRVGEEILPGGTSTTSRNSWRPTLIGRRTAHPSSRRSSSSGNSAPCTSWTAFTSTCPSPCRT